MTDDAAIAPQPPVETPLGIQQPLLPSVPLGQAMLQPKFFTPLGAQSLRVLDPSIFLAVPDLAVPSEELPFQDSPFFDAPKSTPPESRLSQSTPSQSTVSAVQTKPQPQFPNPASPEINRLIPVEQIAETPIAAPLADETSTQETSTQETPIATTSISPDETLDETSADSTFDQALVVETPIAENLTIAEPVISRSLLDEPDTAIAYSAQTEPINLVESRASSISSPSTETPTEQSNEPLLPMAAPSDSDPLLETAIQQPEAPPLERSPDFSLDRNEIPPTPISQPTEVDTSRSPASPSDPKSASPPVDNPEAIASSIDWAIAQPSLNTPDTEIVRSTSPAEPAISASALSDREEGRSVDAIASQPEDSPISITEIIQPKTDDFETTDLINEQLEDPREISLELSSSEPTSDRAEITSIENQTPVQLQSQFNSLAPFSIPHPSEPSQETGTSPDDSNVLSSSEEPAIESQPSLQPSFGSVEETQNFQDLETESFSQPMALETSGQSTHPETHPQVDSVTQLNAGLNSQRQADSVTQLSIEPTIQPQTEAPAIRETLAKLSAGLPAGIAADLSASVIPKEITTQTSSIQPISDIAQPVQRTVTETETLISEAEATAENERFIETDQTSLLPQNLQDLETESLSQPMTLEASGQLVHPEINPLIESVTQPNAEPMIQRSIQSVTQPDIEPTIQPKIETSPIRETLAKLSAGLPAGIAADLSTSVIPTDITTQTSSTQTPSVQPLSEIAQPVQRKVVETEAGDRGMINTEQSDKGANLIPRSLEQESENESFTKVDQEADQTSSLPELSSVLQRLSILEPIATTPQPLYTDPLPAAQSVPSPQSSVIPEIQTKPFESLFDVPFEAPSIRPQRDIGASNYITHNDIASIPTASTPDTLTPNSPVTSEWGTIADLFNTSETNHSTLEPETAFVEDSYPDLMHSDRATPNEMIQTSPTPAVEAAAPVPTETNSDRESSTQTPAQSASSGSPEHLERLAQEVYQLIRQRLALERERVGKSGSGRLL
ncbi:hypothetical protein AB3R30_18505 [Leptolyngbyaceae cyanobacterium UHCC 1019]